MQPEKRANVPSVPGFYSRVLLPGTGCARFGYNRNPKSDIRNPSSYQVNRSVNCNCRAAFCEFLKLRIPVDESGCVIPGIFSTLKKSALKRTTKRSVIRVFLNTEASRPQSMGPG